jgi:hypothetical protein
MKLAEALILRKDAQTKLGELQNRLVRVARIQEGDTPAEDPAELLGEVEAVANTLETLIRQINATNMQTQLADGRTITEALATRDVLLRKRYVLNAVVNQAAQQQARYGNAEIRYVATVNVADLQRQVDDLARQHRELDAEIQQQNWLVDLIEDE